MHEVFSAVSNLLRCFTLLGLRLPRVASGKAGQEDEARAMVTGEMRMKAPECPWQSGCVVSQVQPDVLFPHFLGREARSDCCSVSSLVPPRKRTVSLPQRMVSPQKRTVSLRQRMVSPRKRTVSLRQRMVSPRKSIVPLTQRMVSPRKRMVPRPQRMVSPRKGIVPLLQRRVSPQNR